MEGGSFSFGESGASSAGGSSCLIVTLTGNLGTPGECDKAYEGKASARADGLTISGTVTGNWAYHHNETRLEEGTLFFHPDNGVEGDRVFWDVLSIDAPGPDKWYRDVYYTAQSLGLKMNYTEDGWTGYDGISELMRSETAQQWATRELFAYALAEVAEGYSLTQRFQVTDLSDKEFDRSLYSHYLRSLYEGGILSGVDEYGAFDGDCPLTRGSAAVMVARVLDEDQRLTKPPAPLPTQGYTLTETDEMWVQVYGAKEDDPGPELAIKRGENGLYGYVDRDGSWVIQPQWEDAEAFYDGYTVVQDGDLFYAIDRQGNVVLERAYTRLDNMGEGKFFGKWLEPGKGSLQEVVDVDGWTYPAVYGNYWPTFHHGYGAFFLRPYRTKAFYMDSRLKPISQKFDNCGAIDENGSGLVELDGKIYRIQFEK